VVNRRSTRARPSGAASDAPPRSGGRGAGGARRDSVVACPHRAERVAPLRDRGRAKARRDSVVACPHRAGQNSRDEPRRGTGHWIPACRGRTVMEPSPALCGLSRLQEQPLPPASDRARARRLHRWHEAVFADGDRFCGQRAAVALAREGKDLGPGLELGALSRRQSHDGGVRRHRYLRLLPVIV
jgi:hypothetical protein